MSRPASSHQPFSQQQYRKQFPSALADPTTALVFSTSDDSSPTRDSAHDAEQIDENATSSSEKPTVSTGEIKPAVPRTTSTCDIGIWPMWMTRPEERNIVLPSQTSLSHITRRANSGDSTQHTVLNTQQNDPSDVSEDSCVYVGQGAAILDRTMIGRDGTDQSDLGNVSQEFQSPRRRQCPIRPVVRTAARMGGSTRFRLLKKNRAPSLGQIEGDGTHGSKFRAWVDKVGWEDESVEFEK